MTGALCLIVHCLRFSIAASCFLIMFKDLRATDFDRAFFFLTTAKTSRVIFPRSPAIVPLTFHKMVASSLKVCEQLPGTFDCVRLLNMLKAIPATDFDRVTVHDRAIV